MAQIIDITSEALQATIRRLLPSQRGFGEDLQASNVITPIIDLTPSAEGSELPLELSSAISFDSNTHFEARNGTDAMMNTPGFWRVVGGGTIFPTTSDENCAIQLSDGLTTKIVWQFESQARSVTLMSGFTIDLIIFLQSGDSATALAQGTGTFGGSYRQIADVNGNIVNPTGFTSQ